MTPPLWQKVKRNWRGSWWKWKSEKVGLKLNIKKLRSGNPVPSFHGKLDGETMKTVTDFIFLGSQIPADGDCSHEIKRH